MPPLTARTEELSAKRPPAEPLSVPGTTNTRWPRRLYLQDATLTGWSKNPQRSLRKTPQADSCRHPFLSDEAAQLLPRRRTPPQRAGRASVFVGGLGRGLGLLSGPHVPRSQPRPAHGEAAQKHRPGPGPEPTLPGHQRDENQSELRPPGAREHTLQRARLMRTPAATPTGDKGPGTISYEPQTCTGCASKAIKRGSYTETANVGDSPHQPTNATRAQRKAPSSFHFTITRSTRWFQTLFEGEAKKLFRKGGTKIFCGSQVRGGTGTGKGHPGAEEGREPETRTQRNLTK